jgi:hypothetical protein
LHIYYIMKYHASSISLFRKDPMKIVRHIIFATTVSASLYSTQNPTQSCSQDTQLFYDGFKAGFISTLLVDAARASLPNADALQLHSNYGICRDQLTGQVKALLALIIAAAHCPNKDTWHWRMLAARALGALTGICAASYTEKLVLQR